MKRDAVIFIILAVFAAGIGFSDITESIGDAALILSLMFVTLAGIAMFFVEPIPR